MGLTLPLSARTSTNVRFVLRVAGRRVAFGASSLLAPGLAGLWAERLFLSPPRAQRQAKEAEEFRDARPRWIVHRGRRIATWSWGPHDRTAVLLVHGWGGSAAQMRALVRPLLAEGLRVIAFDHPAHGSSEGSLTGLPDLADVLTEVAWEHGKVRAVVTHSLGGPAAALALVRGLRAECAVLVAAPSDLIGYSRRFARWHWIPESVRSAMQSAIEERFGVPWAELEIARMTPRLAARALLIHDRDDRMVPWTQGRAFAQHWPGARFLLTAGLGHGSILQDDGVVRAIADFIVGRSEVASQVLPPIPHPAPMY
jgi:pimeloyl-ACP methyl ester carboxylesterase